MSTLSYYARLGPRTMTHEEINPDDPIPLDPGAFGKHLLALRKKKRWTQAQLGDALGLSADAIGTYESGRSRPTWETAALLAQQLGVTVREFVDGLPSFASPPPGRSSGAHVGAHSKAERLTKLVLNAQQDETLYVSVGDASFLFAWLDGLYAQSEHRPRIAHVNVLHPSEDELARQTQAGNVEPELRARLRANIKSLRRLLDRNGAKLDELVLDRLPRYHGFLYGDHLFYETWKPDQEGKLHVRSRLRIVRRSVDPSAFADFVAEFEAARSVDAERSGTSAAKAGATTRTGSKVAKLATKKRAPTTKKARATKTSARR